MKYILILCAALVLMHSNLLAQATLNGNAQDLSDGCYQLTQAINTQNGSLWFDEEVDLNEDFDINLIMNFGTNDSGADGIVFVLQNNNQTTQGGGGGGLGYEGIGNSVGIEFDTWQNGDQGDLASDHIGICSNGVNNHNVAAPVQADVNNINIEDGEDHEVRIKWTAASNQIEVFFDCEPRITATYDMVANSFGGDNLVWWGFVASTGGASNNQTVCLNSGTGVPVSFTTCSGAPVELVIGDIDPNEPVTWSPADFLSETDVASPISSTTEDFSYTVDYTHVCGYQATSEVSVIIDELELSSEDVPTISCNDDLVLIQADSNYPDITSEWSTVDGNITVINGLNIVADSEGLYTVVGNYQDLCFDTLDLDIVVDPFGIDVSFAEPLLLDCFNDEVELDATSSNTQVTLEWTTEDGNFISGTETFQPLVDAPGTYTLTVVETETCMGESSIEVLEGEPLILVNQEDYLISCDVTNLALNVTTNYPDMNFSWDDSDGNIFQNDDTLSPQVSEGGDYILSASIGSCDAELIVTVEENTAEYQPILEMITEPNCTDVGIIFLDFEVPGNEVIENGTWVWSTTDGEIINQSSPWTITVGSGGTYNLAVVNNSSGCESDLDIDVTEITSFGLSVPDVVQLTCEEPVANITAEVSGVLSQHDFEWAIGDQIVVGEGANSFSTPNEGIVDLTVNYGDCSENVQIVIEQAPNYSIDLSSLDAPNIFTPNPDDQNELFYPFLKNDATFDVLPFLENYEMKIYNRWGTEIFKTNSGGWNGVYNDNLAETGVYFYHITFSSICGDSANGELTGTVTILK